MAAIFQPTKTAVITGGASGIGLALARKCVGHGMRVLVADRDTAALAAAAESIAADAKGSAGAGGSGSVRTHDMDVTRLDDWGRLKDVVVKEFGGGCFFFLSVWVVYALCRFVCARTAQGGCCASWIDALAPSVLSSIPEPCERTKEAYMHLHTAPTTARRKGEKRKC